MSSGVKIDVKVTGVEECCRILRSVPEKADRLITKGMREAAKPILKDIRTAVPHKSWQKLCKIKVYKTDVGRAMRVGLFNSDRKTWGWFKAYWANYGTLERRDRSHQFLNPVNKAKKKRNKVGQRAQNFYDMAVEGKEEGFFERFNNYLVENEDKLVN